MDLKQIIMKYALQNAVFFKGKASVGSVIGKVIAEKTELKKDMKKVALEVKKIVDNINEFSPDEQRYQLEKLAPELMGRKVGEKKELPELKNAKTGKVVTRIPPEPSKHMHIGHALSFLINYLYARKYKGKCVLRFEDTNPELSKQEYAESIVEDLKFLGIKTDKTVFVSNDIPKFYELAEKLIKKGEAYVCFCDRESMQKLRHKGEECKCRAGTNSLKEWKNMIAGKYKEGKCVLRLKADMKSDNHVMRDPVIFRISKTEHYLQKSKYSVWPMYDFENAVEEELCGITHVMRSNEFGEMRIELQNYIKDLFKFKKQEVIQYGRFNVVGAVTRGREIRQGIQEKKFIGWDDPRLVTVKALKRRGIQKEAFYELAVEVGLSTTPTNLVWTVISSINRKIIDPKCNRYFFIEDPKEITIDKAPKGTAELKIHPDFPERGKRKLKTNNKFLITKKDFNEIKENDLIRVMDCLNFKKTKNKFIFDSKEHAKYKEKGKKIIHWLPADKKELINVEVMMPDAKIKTGLGEKTLSKLKVGDVIQFTRFGFCRLDKKTATKLTFWFTHD